MERMPFCRERARRWWCILLLVLLGVVPAFGQFQEVHVPEHLHAGQPANLFVRWEGQTAVDGLFVQLPHDWALRAVQVLRYGYEPVAATVRPVPGQPGVYEVGTARALDAPHELVFRVETGALPGAGQWTLTPFVRRRQAGRERVERRSAYQLTAPVYLARAPETDNRVLALAPEARAPLLLRRQALPDLGLQAPYTVEFWVRTTGLDEVVLSTWDGDERAAYPLEVVVDVGGRLLAFYGQPGRHHALRTPRPVADGRWHHVALTNAPDEGWTRLYLDGQPADSLFHEVVPSIDLQTPVAVGGRVPAPDSPAAVTFSGLLDELRFWSRPRTRTELRRTMYEPLPDLGAAGVVLGFEAPLPDELLERPAPALRRRPADLDFYLPVRNLRGAVEGQGVVLSWETEDRQTAAFIIERSDDGRHFEEVGRIAVEEALRSGPAARFSFYDPGPGNRVLFYRIRQHFRNGNERISGTVKMGLGAEEEPGAILVGNFPNPFNPVTTIAFTLADRQHVRLEVWDLSGQRVATLVDGERPAGYHEVQFQAGDLPSGPYFIRLQTAEGVQTRQMILAK